MPPPLPPPRATFPALRFSRGVASCQGIPALHGIYRIVCVPLRLAYVGQAYDLAARCLEHQVELRQGTHTNPRLRGAYQRFGPAAFYFEVLEVWSGKYSPDVLSPAEQRWMDAHGQARLFNVRPAGSDAWLRRFSPGKNPPNADHNRLSPGFLPGKNPPNANHNRPGGGENRPSPAENRPLGRGRALGTQSDKDWRNKFPKKEPGSDDRP